MILSYEKKYESLWDDFVLNKSINGNFLQTRNFINYHPSDKFDDASILFIKNGDIAAVLLGNEIDNGKTLIAHQGSTFGGLVIGNRYANTANYNWIFDEMMLYYNQKGYERVEMRMHSWLYSPNMNINELCDYYFQLKGFKIKSEIGFFIDLGNITENYEDNFDKLRRRKLNKARKSRLEFRKLLSDCEIKEFYFVLTDNMRKFNTVPVHTLEELLEFKNHRLSNITSFYGVFHGEKMIAGSMVWNFCDKKVFHTQYLASLKDCLEMCPNEFLYTNLIKAAVNEGYRYLSYGTASLNHGDKYNETLGMYKEGFNTDSYLNRCYIWEKHRNNYE